MRERERERERFMAGRFSPRNVQVLFSVRSGGFDFQVETESALDPLDAKDTVSIVRVERARRLKYITN